MARSSNRIGRVAIWLLGPAACGAIGYFVIGPNLVGKKLPVPDQVLHQAAAATSRFVAPGVTVEGAEASPKSPSPISVTGEPTNVSTPEVPTSNPEPQPNHHPRKKRKRSATKEVKPAEADPASTVPTPTNSNAPDEGSIGGAVGSGK